MVLGKCKHQWDEGEIEQSHFSYGHGIVNYNFTCIKCGAEMSIERDVS